MTEDDNERLAGLPPVDEPAPVKERRQNKAREEKDRAQMLLQSYADILASRSGRMVFFDMLDKMGYSKVPFDPTSPHMTAYLAGNHAGAVDLYETLWAIEPDDVLKMMKENRK